LNLEGENVLNTLQSQLSFTYNRDEGYKEFGFSAVYGALFPYISGGAGYIFNRQGYNNQSKNNYYFNQTDLHAGLQLPLNLSYGKNLTFLQAGSDLYYARAFYPQANQSYTYSNNYINFSNSIQQAKQKHLSPLWAKYFIKL